MVGKETTDFLEDLFGKAMRFYWTILLTLILHPFLHIQIHIAVVEITWKQ